MSAEILRDLARVKAVFQLRAIAAIIGAPASVDRSPEGGDVLAAPSRSDESAVDGEAGETPTTKILNRSNPNEPG